MSDWKHQVLFWLVGTLGYYLGKHLERRSNTKVAANSASHNRQSMQCCPDCGYPFGSRNQCLNGNCVRCRK
jgi:hypothetical protein